MASIEVSEQADSVTIKVVEDSPSDWGIEWEKMGIEAAIVSAGVTPTEFSDDTMVLPRIDRAALGEDFERRVAEQAVALYDKYGDISE